ncbi:MAG: hypothetical protein KDA28_03575, partial [Phycisphaerales bacterium]|nr:hypothetical protein [Phycisphaerales bacterium]
MNRTNTPSRRASGLAAATVLGAVGAASVADDGPIINYGSASSYTYRLNLLPDIDQKRLGLPNDGKAYCVPTSILNLCAYAGNHGFEDDVLCNNYWMLYYQLDLFFTEVTGLDLAL